MRLVIDTNILLSALIRDSLTRKMIVESDWTLYYPEISFHEIRKYQKLVLEKSGMIKEEYDDLLAHLLDHILLVPDEKIFQNLEEAKQIMAHIDPDDVVFIAAALSLHNTILWSDDKDFQKQDKINQTTTKQIANQFLNI